jgi:ribonuclease PH
MSIQIKLTELGCQFIDIDIDIDIDQGGTNPL